MNDRVPDTRVIFPLDQDDGWPPVSAERMWAYSLGQGSYRIDNVPWFVRDLAVGDEVHAVAPDDASHPVFVRLLTRSDHLTIRLICLRNGPLQGDLQAVLDVFVPLGVYAEGVTQYGMVALDIPPTALLEPIYFRLRNGQQDGSWDWEEGRINDRWRALGGAGI